MAAASRRWAPARIAPAWDAGRCLIRAAKETSLPRFSCMWTIVVQGNASAPTRAHAGGIFISMFSAAASDVHATVALCVFPAQTATRVRVTSGICFDVRRWVGDMLTFSLSSQTADNRPFLLTILILTIVLPLSSGPRGNARRPGTVLAHCDCGAGNHRGGTSGGQVEKHEYANQVPHLGAPAGWAAGSPLYTL
jgi:hypothetical protein